MSLESARTGGILYEWAIENPLKHKARDFLLRAPPAANMRLLLQTFFLRCYFEKPENINKDFYLFQ